MSTKKKKDAKKKDAKKKTSNGAPKKPPKAQQAASVADANGLTKGQKANLTRFARDLSAKVINEHAHLTPAKIRTALMTAGNVRDTYIKHGSLASSEAGFMSAVKEFLAQIPISKRQKLSPEEREKREKARRDGLLSTAKGGAINEYSMHALKTHYLQGLKAEERAAAKSKFERAAGR